MLNKVVLYFHTLRYLKPQQIYRRFWFRLIKPCLDDSPAPTIRKRLGTFFSPARRVPSLLDSDTFYFLNQAGALSKLGWVDICETGLHSKLWRYNQHYFDDLNAFKSEARKKWHSRVVRNIFSDLWSRAQILVRAATNNRGRAPPRRWRLALPSHVPAARGARSTTVWTGSALGDHRPSSAATASAEAVGT